MILGPWIELSGKVLIRLDRRGRQFVALLRSRRKSKKVAASAADSKSQEEHQKIYVKGGQVYSWAIIVATRRIRYLSHDFRRLDISNGLPVGRLYFLCLNRIVLNSGLVRIAIHNVRRIGVTGVVVILEYLFIGIFGVWILTYDLFLGFIKIV
jgi:hypothetical protein